MRDLDSFTSAFLEAAHMGKTYSSAQNSLQALQNASRTHLTQNLAIFIFKMGPNRSVWKAWGGGAHGERSRLVSQPSLRDALAPQPCGRGDATRPGKYKSRHACDGAGVFHPRGSGKVPLSAVPSKA